MSPLTVTSVASAAIISGDLIIGLSDGSIINCGRVQGPQGLDGPAGPIGAPGRPGQDGNTILTSEGFPRPDVGTNGDFIIDKVSWTIYGPKANGVWGTGTPLRGNGGSGRAQPRDLADGVPTSGDGGGGGRIYNTSNLALTGLGRSKTERRIDAPGGNIIPEGTDLKFQANLNRWIVNSFVALDDALPVSVGDVLPDEGEYEGVLFLKDGILYIYTKGEWIAVGGESGPPVYVGEDEPPNTPQTGELWYCTDEKYLTLFIYTGTTWAPAAPPVSLDGIEAGIAGLTYAVDELKTITTGQGQDIADAKSTQYGIASAIKHLDDDQQRQDNQIIELEEEIESLAPSLDRGKWLLNETTPLSAGEYAMGVAVNSGYCIDQYERCVQAAPGYPDNIDPIAQSECTRLAAECETAKENGELYVADWAHAAFLHFHKTDSDGKNHTFADYKVGMFIDLFDQGDTGFAVFEITAAPTLDGDVYTIGVHPIQHEGEASGLARIKAFELASSDPTDYVRKTGDTMTGMLKLEPTAGSTSLTVKSNPEATNLSNIVDVVNNKGDQVFWIDSLRAGFTGKSGRPASDYHLTDKKYVDEAIHAAITKETTAPARLEWYVYTSRSTKPSPGKAHVSGTSMLNSNIVILSLRPNNSAYEIQAGSVTGKTMHIYQGTYRPLVLTAWYFREFDGGGEWKWKGSTDVDRVKLYESYIYIATGPSNYRTANSDFSDDLRYRFTLSGFF